MEENSAAMLARWLMEQREHRGRSMKPPFLANLSRKTVILRPIILFADRSVTSANRGSAWGENYFAAYVLAALYLL